MRSLRLLPLVVLVCGLAASTANAIPVLHQTAQGSYTTNVLGGSDWDNFTSAMNASHTLFSTADFTNAGELALYDAVWVDQELDNSLSTTEVANLQSYVAAGNKLVLIGENASWPMWNASLMSVVGGAYSADCSWATGTSLAANSLTAGVSSVQNICGSQLNNSGSVQLLFSNNMAGVYNIGAGQALVILDSNWNDDTYGLSEDNEIFAANVVSWLGQPLNAVPEPGTIALLSLGLAGLGFVRRKRA